MSFPSLLLIDPARPLLSWAVIAGIAVLLLYLARPYTRALIGAVLGGAGRTFRGAGRMLGHVAAAAWKRHRALVVEYRLGEIEQRLVRQLDRLETVMRCDLSRYPELHRALADLIGRVRQDYAAAGLSEEPDLISTTYHAAEPNVASAGSDKLSVVPRITPAARAVPVPEPRQNRPAIARLTRWDERRRLRLLGRGVRRLGPIEARLAGLQELDQRARETVSSATALVADYRALLESDERAVASAGDSAFMRFFVALLFLAVAAGGSLLNFQLIARPMAELVGTGYEIQGVSLAQIAALTMILIETAVGIVLMEALGISRLFPVFVRIDRPQRRLLAIGAAILLIGLAGVEAGLAYLREILIAVEQQAVAATMGVSSHDAGRALGFLPIAVQAALGFAIPFVLALIAIPLEVLAETGRAVVQAIWASLVSAGSLLFRIGATVLHFIERVAAAAYDVVIFLPLAIERVVLFAVRRS